MILNSKMCLNLNEINNLRLKTVKIVILIISPTNIQLYENENCHSHHNNTTEPIGVKEKEFFSDNFDKGICTSGALIRSLRKHNDTEKLKEKVTLVKNKKKRESGETLIDVLGTC
jgi:hypothetical protein